MPDVPYSDFTILEEISPYTLPVDGIPSDEAYRRIHDSLTLDGSSRLNLATFVTTWMEPQAERLLAESFDKNSIDRDEYPSIAEIERRCVNIVSRLYNASLQPREDATGAATIGSSEAVMLAGLAAKWRWKNKRKAEGKDVLNPNIVLGSNVQVVWEKFCRYFEVEPRYLPIESDRYVISPEQVADAVDENTILVVGILGTTFTGEFEDIKGISSALDEVARRGGPDVPVHVDAASGGFVAPFSQPELEWDFRLPRVVSINVSGHKYGLVYPGIGFVVWRSAEYLPSELGFEVSYLGGKVDTYTLNFSRPGNQIVGQYYNFIRFGRAGYTQIMDSLLNVTRYLANGINEIEGLESLSTEPVIPVLSFKVKPGKSYTAHDISHELRSFGWQVPAYSLPENATDVTVLRVVLRIGFAAEFADAFLRDLKITIKRLEAIGSVQAFKDTFAH